MTAGFSVKNLKSEYTGGRWFKFWKNTDGLSEYLIKLSIISDGERKCVHFKAGSISLVIPKQSYKDY